MSLEYRRLGRSGLQVSPLTLGSMMCGGQTDVCVSPRTIEATLEVPITADDETFVDSVVTPWHASIPGYKEPTHIVAGRLS
ncbi:hypothetical protein SAMN05216588_102145 [Pseudomonas flavescens]|uniref:Aldo/keto reductase family protein n=1 Tax=Phytopseudomonas flavescens TaxID=29435 RepID=A0A1G7Z1I8_9GAMM|nr:hypothetical protein [Pseudomonas flavescens]SDH02030.1 hypothetical protein SAMN05216588_102145 [Pseudomonas flavescens]